MLALLAAVAMAAVSQESYSPSSKVRMYHDKGTYCLLVLSQFRNLSFSETKPESGCLTVVMVPCFFHDGILFSCSFLISCILRFPLFHAFS